MNEPIIIYTVNKIIIKLIFIDAVHPSKVPLKADHWYPYYHLLHGKDRISPYLHSEKYLYDEDLNYFLSVAYYDKINDSNEFEFDSDLESFLVILDFNKKKITKFSKLSGGHFKNFKFAKKFLSYDKIKNGIQQSIEVYYSDLNWINF